MKPATKRILFIGDSLAQGGAERVQGHLSVFFSDAGYELYHFLMHAEVVYTHRGEVVIMPEIQGFLPIKLFRKWLFFKKNVTRISPDIIIDFRFRHRQLQEVFLLRFLKKYTYIPSIHSANLHWYLPKSPFLTHFLYRNVPRMHAVSEGIKKSIEERYSLQNLVAIPNPVMVSDVDSTSPFSSKYVLAVGRMNDGVKQFDHLIEAFSKAHLMEQNIHLVILGEGAFASVWQSYAEQRQVDKFVHFLGYKKEVTLWMKHAEVMVLCSKNEGFPNVLVESLALGTPVISYDCETGPSEIVQDGVNGILVENQSIKALTIALKTYFEDPKLQQKLRRNAQRSVERFSLTEIGRRWELLLSEAHSRK